MHPVKRPDRVFDPRTGQFVADPVQKALSDPRVVAIKNDPKMSREDKVKALNALGIK